MRKQQLSRHYTLHGITAAMRKLDLQLPGQLRACAARYTWNGATVMSAAHAPLHVDAR
jgi:hypothetical protein